jgi:hypothetical protein
MDKLGEALVIITIKADEKHANLCNYLWDECNVTPIPCTKCIYYNHKLLDKPIEILNKLGE